MPRRFLQEDKTHLTVQAIRQVDNIVILAVLAFSYMFVFASLKLKQFDLTGLLSLFLYLTAAVIRVIMDLKFVSSVFVVFSLCTQVLLWYSLYYFVLELLRIKLMIQQDSLAQF